MMVNVPNLITYVKWAHVFEWCVNRCGSKNGHQNHIGSKEIGYYKEYTKCSNFVNHFRIKDQHIFWGGRREVTWSFYGCGAFGFDLVVPAKPCGKHISKLAFSSLWKTLIISQSTLTTSRIGYELHLYE